MFSQCILIYSIQISRESAAYNDPNRKHILRVRRVLFEELFNNMRPRRNGRVRLYLKRKMGQNDEK